MPLPLLRFEMGVGKTGVKTISLAVVVESLSIVETCVLTCFFVVVAMLAMSCRL